VSLSKQKKKFSVLILAGGYGTRLYPLTLDVPKPLLKIGSRVVIDFAIDKLRDIKELKEIFVVTNAKFYRNFCDWKKKVRFTKKITIINDGTRTEKNRLGSIGDLYYTIKKKNINSDLLVIGGDNIFQMGLNHFVDFAYKNSPYISIGIFDVKKKEMAHRYGVVHLDRQKKITSFVEKPKHPSSTLAAMCVYYFPKKSLSFLKQYMGKFKNKTDAAGNYIRWLIEKSKVYGFKFRGSWLDIGQIDTYKKAKKEFSKLTN